MKTTFTFDRLEIEELIRQKLCEPPHGKVNKATEFMNFKFLGGDPAPGDPVIVVEVEKKISMF
jgi:hypothetical protein